jgi:hypothetical protein
MFVVVSKSDDLQEFVQAEASFENEASSLYKTMKGVGSESAC